jgi:hypothetical protein
MKRSTFNSGDHALYSVQAADGTKQSVSVVVQRCSYFCPEFVKEDGGVQPEQSFYTVRLDGDIVPSNPNFTEHCGLIHKVGLEELRPYTVSADYVLNKGLWDLKAAAMEATHIAAEATKKYEALVDRLKAWGSIKPGSRIIWYEPGATRASSALVSKIDFVAGYCLVDGDHRVELNHNLFSWHP